jgi:NADH-quinone oxidoreductase subunit N
MGVTASESTTGAGGGTGSRTSAGTAQRVVRELTVVLHTAAVVSLLLGISSGVWLAVVLPS